MSQKIEVNRVSSMKPPGEVKHNEHFNGGTRQACIKIHNTKYVPPEFPH